ncbi:MAG TPA: serine/threonine-protein kinase, partial [Flavobacteriales bacterium]|nr:serine/threonine-protein kinase [Flavobacteriales bacterium]
MIKKICICYVCIFPFLYRQRTRRLYSRKSLLGKGRFGNVYLAYDHTMSSEVAIKTICLKKYKKHNTRNIYNERFILEKLSNPQIVNIINSYEKNNIFHIVLELCPGEELFFTIRRCGAMPTELALPLFNSMLSTLHYIHSCNIVHRDIKLENLIYCAQTHSIKWIDFDLAKYTFHTKELERLTTSVGTLSYCAPEILSTYVRYNGKCIDVWSLGIVFYTILCGDFPFVADDAHHI